MIAQPPEAGQDHVLFLIWLLKNHPDIKFSEVCKAVTLQSTGELAYIGKVRLWAQQRKQRISENLSNGILPIRGIDYPSNYNPFETFLQPTDIFKCTTFHHPAIKLFTNKNTTMATSGSPLTDKYDTKLPKNMDSDKFMDHLMKLIREKNPDDQFPVQPDDLVSLSIFDGENNPPLHALYEQNAKHIHDVLSRDGNSTSTQLTVRALLKEVNERYDDSNVNLQEYNIGGETYQTVKFTQYLDGKFAKYHEDQANEHANLMYGDNPRRTLAYSHDASEAVAQSRWIPKVVYFLLPNRRNNFVIKYSNDQYNEELIGFDEIDEEPIFADHAPSDPEQLFATHHLTPFTFNINGEEEEEEEENEEDDDMGDAAGDTAKKTITVTKATIMFQLTQVGASGGFKKKSAAKSPPRNRKIGAAFTSPTRQG